MTSRGHFIVVEGLEGAGKSTAVNTIKTFLTSNVGDFLSTREPGGTTVGEAVRQLIKHAPENESLDARAELLLLYASRIQLLERVIKPALKRGQWVLADRFELSTYAYQGGGRGLSEDIINRLSTFSLEGFTPDLIIFLDVEPQVGLSRAFNRGKVDRIEQESLEFFSKVYDAYHAKIKTLPQVVLIDSTQSEHQVQNAIIKKLTDYFDSLGKS